MKVEMQRVQPSGFISLPLRSLEFRGSVFRTLDHAPDSRTLCLPAGRAFVQGKVIELSLTPEDSIVVVGALLRSERRHLAKVRNAPDYLTAEAHRGSAAHCLAIADRITEICEEAQV
jgi:hypothetical protein